MKLLGFGSVAIGSVVCLGLGAFLVIGGRVPELPAPTMHTGPRIGDASPSAERPVISEIPAGKPPTANEVLESELAAGNRQFQERAIQAIRALAQSDPERVADAMADWVEPMLAAGFYADIQIFSRLAIVRQPENTSDVFRQQAALVHALNEPGPDVKVSISGKGQQVDLTLSFKWEF